MENKIYSLPKDKEPNPFIELFLLAYSDMRQHCYDPTDFISIGHFFQDNKWFSGEDMKAIAEDTEHHSKCFSYYDTRKS